MRQSKKKIVDCRLNTSPVFISVSVLVVILLALVMRSGGRYLFR